MDAEIEKTEEKEKETPDLYHNPSNLWRISGWSRVISWIVLVAVTISVAGNVNQLIKSVTAQNIPFKNLFIPIEQGLLFPVVNVVYSLALGVFFFLVLQAVAEGLLILIDIEENTRPKN